MVSLPGGREGISAATLAMVPASVFYAQPGHKTGTPRPAAWYPGPSVWLGASPPSGCEGIYRRLCGEEDGMDKGVRGKGVEGEICSGIFRRRYKSGTGWPGEPGQGRLGPKRGT